MIGMVYQITHALSCHRFFGFDNNVRPVGVRRCVQRPPLPPVGTGDHTASGMPFGILGIGCVVGEIKLRPTSNGLRHWPAESRVPICASPLDFANASFARGAAEHAGRRGHSFHDVWQAGAIRDLPRLTLRGDGCRRASSYCARSQAVGRLFLSLAGIVMYAFGKELALERFLLSPSSPSRPASSSLPTSNNFGESPQSICAICDIVAAGVAVCSGSCEARLHKVLAWRVLRIGSHHQPFPAASLDEARRSQSPLATCHAVLDACSVCASSLYASAGQQPVSCICVGVSSIA